MQWRHPRLRLGVALMLLLGVLSLGLASPRTADAVLTTTTACGSIGSAPIASTSSFECDYVTQQPLVPAALPPANATLTLTIVSPAGTVFTGAGFTTPPPPPGTPIPPPPPCVLNPTGATLNVTCSYTSGTNGLPIGTVFNLAMTGGNTAGVITMTATYTNPPGAISISPPVPPFNYQFDTSVGNASITTFFNTAAPTGVACSATNRPPGAQIVVGDALTCTVTYPSAPGQTPSFVTVTGNNNATVNSGPTANSRTGGNTTGFLCGNPVTNAACTSITFTGIAAGVTSATNIPSFTITSYAIGAATAYSTITIPLPNTSIVAPTPGPTPTPPPLSSGSLTAGALGCADATQPTDIAFPAVALTTINPTGPQVLAGTTQFTTTPPLSGRATVPAILSTVAPNVAAECGAVFQDTGILATDADANPNTIDAGTITYTVNSPLAVITESNSSTYVVNCGTVAPPPLAPNNGCNGAVSSPAFSSPPPTPAFLSPNPANIFHVALVPGATFALLGNVSALISVSATYNRVAAPGTPSLTLTTNNATILVLPPPYQVALTANPLQVGASGNGAGSTITATMVHPGLFGCVPLSTGTYVICTGAPTLFFFGTPAAGAESGLVTFRTNAGVIGNPNDLSTSATQLEYSVHCGPIQQPSVIITATLPSFSSCGSVSVVLYGAGAPGTATVTASFVGDVTGATANAVTNVQLIPSGPPVTLTRGCNQVITPINIAAGTPISQIAALVQPSNIVVGIWQFNNSIHSFLAGYFNVPGAPTDFSTTGPTQSLFICVNGTGTFPSGAI